jgi:REP element-mobilizing transposase RayT
MRTHPRIIVAHHLILHGYGHWLPNDPRGSGSEVVREDKFVPLGAVHHGRKPVQPLRETLKTLYHSASPLLEHAPIWIDDAKRQSIGDAFGEVARRKRYTVWACAVLKNHAHLCIRRHRDDALLMWRHFAQESSHVLRLFADIDAGHPVWSNRPYKVFLYDREDVTRVVRYIESNPDNEGLAPQRWGFVSRFADSTNIAKRQASGEYDDRLRKVARYEDIPSSCGDSEFAFNRRAGRPRRAEGEESVAG